MTGPAPTPGQTVGPFFHLGLPYADDRLLVPADTPGAVVLHGVVTDGAGRPVPDALVEVWQADERGHIVQQQGSLRRDGSAFTGFGRCATDGDGRYSFVTVVPGAVDDSPAFYALAVFARGLLHRLATRAYVPSEDTVDDAVLRAAGDRAGTLMCVPNDGLRFDIRLQGDGETVFLDPR